MRHSSTGRAVITVADLFSDLDHPRSPVLVHLVETSGRLEPAGLLSTTADVTLHCAYVPQEWSIDREEPFRMSKFNRQVKPPPGKSVIKTVGDRGDVMTYEGAPAFTRTSKSELFQLAVVNMVGEDTFYERAKDRDDRYVGLVQSVALADPDWIVKFITWLRSSANMRSASLVAAAEVARAFQVKDAAPRVGGDAGLSTAPSAADRVGNDVGPVRGSVNAALQRADEPGELIGYWISKYGRRIPKGMKRGISDAVVRLYDEYSLLKYDTVTNAVRFGDVLELCHPDPGDGVKLDTTCPQPNKARFATPEAAPSLSVKGDVVLHTYLCACGWYHLTKKSQRYVQDAVTPVHGPRSALFKYAIDRRHNRDEYDLSLLPKVNANIQLRKLAVDQPGVLASDIALADAGITWEDALSLGGRKLDKAALWKGILPSMGYMATLRNLGNLDRAGISGRDEAAVIAKLTNPEQVKRSRQFPYRFMNAYLNVDSVRWYDALEKALNLSVANLPKLSGRTLVLVDTSASMNNSLSGRGKMTCVMAGALFGVALTVGGQNVDLYGFANGHRPFRHQVKQGASVLRETERFCKRIGEDGHGTEIAGSVRKTFNKHDRVVIITDLQTFGAGGYGNDRHLNAVVPADVPIYAFNTGGYAATPLDTREPNRHELGGLTDHTFKLIPLLERGEDAGWPWEIDTAV